KNVYGLSELSECKGSKNPENPEFESRLPNVNTMYNKQLRIEIKTKNAYSRAFCMAANKNGNISVARCVNATPVASIVSEKHDEKLVLKTAFTAWLQIEMVTTGRVSVRKAVLRVNSRLAEKQIETRL
ncbi:unnamed protein product, partial [Heterotrigona itama]